MSEIRVTVHVSDARLRARADSLIADIEGDRAAGADCPPPDPVEQIEHELLEEYAREIERNAESVVRHLLDPDSPTVAHVVR